jgi:PKD repeat protein
MLMAVSATAARAQSSPKVTATIEPSTVVAGDSVKVYANAAIAADAFGQTTTATVDPLEIGVSKFVTPMEATSYAPDRCPSGHECFVVLFLRTDIYTTPGRHTVSVTVTDAKGRTGVGTATVTITPPLDSDGDGLPDLWETSYGLNPNDPTGNNGANGDPDGDGVTNIEEYRAQTNPVAHYQRVFAEGSYGNRQSLTTCFSIAPWDDTSSPFLGPIRVLVIGDNGRTSDGAASYAYRNSRVCPLGDRPPFVADRIVAVIIESVNRLAIERTMQTVYTDISNATPLNASLGVESPSRTWHFARGAAGRGLDMFFLAFNPGTAPVDATFTFTGEPAGVPTQITRTLAPGVRTTIWLDQDLPDAASFDAATTVTASDGIYVERAWRFQAPGRTAPMDSVTRGASVPSTTWYFAAGDLSAPFDTSFVIFNPSDTRTSVDATFLSTDGNPVKRGFDLLPHSRQILRPRDLGIGAAAVGLMLTSANGVGIIAERTTDGATESGAWRQSNLGATTAGTSWTFAVTPSVYELDSDSEIVIANTSTVAGRARLYINAGSDDDGTQIREVDLPPQRIVRVPAKFIGGWMNVVSEKTTGDIAPTIVVERATYVTVDGVSHARQVTLVGNVTR